MVWKWVRYSGQCTGTFGKGWLSILPVLSATCWILLHLSSCANNCLNFASHLCLPFDRLPLPAFRTAGGCSAFFVAVLQCQLLKNIWWTSEAIVLPNWGRTRPGLTLETTCILKHVHRRFCTPCRAGSELLEPSLRWKCYTRSLGSAMPDSRAKRARTPSRSHRYEIDRQQFFDPACTCGTFPTIAAKL